MKWLKSLSKNQKITLLGVFVADMSGIAVPIILNLRDNEVESPPTTVEPNSTVSVGSITGDGTVIGDNATVTVIKNQGVDPNLLDKLINEAAKGRAIEQTEQWKDQLAKAIERIKNIEAEGNRPDAEKALDELRESGDLSGLQALLIKDRDEHQQALIQRNREIASVAFLKGDIDIAIEAVDEILRELPDELYALSWRGRIHRLQGRLNEAENDCKRILELATETGNNRNRAMALGNLGLVYQTRGDLDKAEEMLLKALEIYEKLGRLEGMASNYCNLGLVYEGRGDLDKAEEMLLKSLEINEKPGRLEGIANNYSALGLVYKTRGDLDKARQYWEQAVGLYKKIGMPHMVEKIQGWLDEIEK